MKKKFLDNLFLFLPIIGFELIAFYNFFLCITNDCTNNFLFLVSLVALFVGPLILYDEFTMFDDNKKR